MLDMQPYRNFKILCLQIIKSVQNAKQIGTVFVKDFLFLQASFDAKHTVAKGLVKVNCLKLFSESGTLSQNTGW
jgi:hypothetical protein